MAVLPGFLDLTHYLERDVPADVAAATSPRQQRSLRRVRKFAELMDARFAVPGTSIRFGYDTIIGLLPVVGDAASAALAFLPVLEAFRLGVRRVVLAKMLSNIGVDFLVGLVPGLDLVLDTAFKASLRNARLLEAELIRTV
jgi:hypothetical protein